MTRKNDRLNSSFNEYQRLRGFYTLTFSIVILLIKFIDYEQKVFYFGSRCFAAWFRFRLCTGESG